MKRRVMTVGAIFVLAMTLLVPVAQARAGKTIAQRLANVVVPANCDMPKHRLHNGQSPKRFLPAYGTIELTYAARPIKVHLRRHGTQLLAQYGCSAGGVSWPETLVLYDRHNRLIDSLDLGPIDRQEHAQVDKWRAKGHRVKLRWRSYEGAGFTMKHHKSTLRLVHNKLVLK